MITINPTSQDVITIQLSDADQIQLNTTAILLEDRDVDTLDGENGAYYLDRDNHTGTQAVNTITGLATVATSGSYNDLSNKPTISTDAETLDGQDGAYYLSRSNHTGSDQISDVTGLQDALNLKLDAADYNDRFLGLFSSVFDLEAAHPTANAGDYAQVDFGIGMDVIVYAWDVSDTKWSAVGSSAIANTDALPEGSSNLYFTSQRVRDTPLTGLSTASATPITAADSVLSAAGKLQAQISATAAKADAALAAIDAFNPANLSDAGTLLPNDQLVIWRDGVMLRTTVAAFGGGSEPTPTQLMLIPTGAVESADGDYQRFVYDGGHAYEVAPETFYPIWHAELSAQDRQSEYQIKLKMPELTDDQAINVFITEADISLAALLERDFNCFALELRANDGSTGLLLNIADDQPNSSYVIFSQPAAGSVITLTLTTSSLDYVYDGGTGSMDIPADFFANPPNIWAYSGSMSAADVMPLSIKVLHTE